MITTLTDFSSIGLPVELYIIILSAFMGSFYNVVIFRTPKIMQYDWDKALYEKSVEVGKPLPEPKKDRFATLWGRSYCVSCNTKIPAWFNVPVLGWVLLLGKSACCKKPIGIRYPIVELTMALFGYLLYQEYSLSQPFFFYYAAFSLLLLMAFIDYDSYWLPDFLVYPFLWLGLGFAILGHSEVSALQSLYGVLAGYLGLYIIGEFYLKLRGIHGMAYGDYKLTAGLGAWLGPIAVPYFVLFGVVVTLLMLVLARRFTSKTYLPFGPGLIVGALLYFIFF